MSFGSVFYLFSVVLAYKLGFHSSKDPDCVGRWLKAWWSWLNKNK
jgi:hypothetical protein